MKHEKENRDGEEKLDTESTTEEKCGKCESGSEKDCCCEDAENNSEKSENCAGSASDVASEIDGANEADASENGEQLDPIAALEKKVAELEKENAELKNQALYKIAEFDNYRKRMMKEKQDAFDFANEKLLKDLLDSLDNFDRTVEAAANATDVSAIVDGVKMVNANLVKMLEEKHNLSSYGKAGEPFNPDEHEAIGSVQGDVAEPTLKEVYLKGYKLKDRVIRHAKVMVEMPV